VHRHGTWPARRSLSSSASRAKHHTGARGSAQTLGLTNNIRELCIVVGEGYASVQRQLIGFSNSHWNPLCGHISACAELQEARMASASIRCSHSSCNRQLRRALGALA